MLKTLYNKQGLIDFLVVNKTPELLATLSGNPMYSYADAIKDAEEYMLSKYIKGIYNTWDWIGIEKWPNLLWIIWLKKVNLINWTWDLFLFVDPNYSWMWIWTTALAEFIGLCMSAWIRKINLTVHWDNTWAIHLYEKLGWTKVGTYHKQIKRSGDRYIDVLIYEKFLY